MTTAPPGSLTRDYNFKHGINTLVPNRSRLRRSVISVFSASLQCSGILGRLDTSLRSTTTSRLWRSDSSEIFLCKRLGRENCRRYGWCSFRSAYVCSVSSSRSQSLLLVRIFILHVSGTFEIFADPFLDRSHHQRKDNHRVADHHRLVSLTLQFAPANSFLQR